APLKMNISDAHLLYSRQSANWPMMFPFSSNNSAASAATTDLYEKPRCGKNNSLSNHQLYSSTPPPPPPPPPSITHPHHLQQLHLQEHQQSPQPDTRALQEFMNYGLLPFSSNHVGQYNTTFNNNSSSNSQMETFYIPSCTAPMQSDTHSNLMSDSHLQLTTEVSNNIFNNILPHANTERLVNVSPTYRDMIFSYSANHPPPPPSTTTTTTTTSNTTINPNSTSFYISSNVSGTDISKSFQQLDPWTWMNMNTSAVNYPVTSSKSVSSSTDLSSSSLTSMSSLSSSLPPSSAVHNPIATVTCNKAESLTTTISNSVPATVMTPARCSDEAISSMSSLMRLSPSSRKYTKGLLSLQKYQHHRFEDFLPSGLFNEQSTYKISQSDRISQNNNNSSNNSDENIGESHGSLFNNITPSFRLPPINFCDTNNCSQTMSEQMTIKSDGTAPPLTSTSSSSEVYNNRVTENYKGEGKNNNLNNNRPHRSNRQYSSVNNYDPTYKPRLSIQTYQQISNTKELNSLSKRKRSCFNTTNNNINDSSSSSCFSTNHFRNDNKSITDCNIQPSKPSQKGSLFKNNLELSSIFTSHENTPNSIDIVHHLSKSHFNELLQHNDSDLHKLHMKVTDDNYRQNSNNDSESTTKYGSKLMKMTPDNEINLPHMSDYDYTNLSFYSKQTNSALATSHGDLS
ncbi:unnamed protein product, partial [Heterobilharzia americana]